MKIIDRKIIQRYYDKNKKTHNQLNNKVIESNLVTTPGKEYPAYNSAQKEVMKKILYGVETGGNVYGNQDYTDVTLPYTNSGAEHAITIGAGQWYATEDTATVKTNSQFKSCNMEQV